MPIKALVFLINLLNFMNTKIPAKANWIIGVSLKRSFNTKTVYGNAIWELRFVLNQRKVAM